MQIAVVVCRECSGKELVAGEALKAESFERAR